MIRKINLKFLLPSIILLIILNIIFTYNINTAKDKLEREVKYISYQVQLDDTLWDISNHYNTDSNLTCKEYINDIKHINNLKSDKILAGEYLIIPIYSYVQ